MNIKGQALLEYLLIIAVIGVFVIFFFTAFGSFVKDEFTSMACDLLGKEYVAGEEKGQGKCID